MTEHDNGTHNVPITMESTASDVIQQILLKGSYPESDEWCLVEVLEGQRLHRILGIHNSVLSTHLKLVFPSVC